MSTVTTGKSKCPLCGAGGCSYGEDGNGNFLHCENPLCPPNAAGGRVADWYVQGEEAAKIHAALWGK